MPKKLEPAKLLLLALMGLAVATPLLKPAMLCGDDFPGHLSHLVELDAMWKEGVLYPRWSPDVAFGYGLPTFNFYPPLPRYVGAIIHWLGLPLRDAVKAPMVLALMLAGPAMYLFVKSVYGERAGLFAGIAYAFAPYLADDALQRFALNEALAMSLAPLVLWVWGRLNAGSPRLPWGRVSVAGLAAAALILAHPLMALMFAPLILVYLLTVWWQSSSRTALTGRVALAAMLTLGLTAFFWWPFMAESGFVQMWRARVWELTGELLYPLHFRSLETVLWPRSLWPDYMTSNSLLQRVVALPQVIGAVIALALVRRLPTRLARAMTVLFGAALVISIFLITRESKPIWDIVTPLQIVQFPWRFLAPASFAASVLTGVAVSNVKFQVSYFRWRWAAFDAALVMVLMAWTLPWIRPFTCNIEANPSNSFLVWVDRKTGGGGGTGEDLPRWAEALPQGSLLEADLLAGRSLDRLDRDSLPEGAEAQARTLQSLDSTWEVNSSKAFTVSFQNYFFPGWTVRVDNVLVSIAPAPSTGLIEAGLPAGQHVVGLRLEVTPVQRLGDAISIGTLAIMTVLLLVKRRTSVMALRDAKANAMLAWEWGTLGAVTVVLFIARIGIANLAPPAVPDGLAIPATVTRTSIDLGAQVQLIGYEFGSPAIRAGEPLTVTLYWQTKSLLLTSYKSFVHVTDASGRLIAQDDAVPRNWTYPTTAWFPDERVVDPHRLDIPRQASGPLHVWAGMYDPDTSQRLIPANDPSGRVSFGTLAVTPP